MATVMKSINDILHYTPTKEELDAYEEFKKIKKNAALREYMLTHLQSGS